MCFFFCPWLLETWTDLDKHRKRGLKTCRGHDQLVRNWVEMARTVGTRTRRLARPLYWLPELCHRDQIPPSLGSVARGFSAERSFPLDKPTITYVYFWKKKLFFTPDNRHIFSFLPRKTWSITLINHNPSYALTIFPPKPFMLPRLF